MLKTILYIYIMAKMKKDTLKAVNIRSTPVKSPQSVLKGGKQIPTRKIDSVRKANPAMGNAIGKPYKGSGGMDSYGADASDKIKKVVKK